MNSEKTFEKIFTAREQFFYQVILIIVNKVYKKLGIGEKFIEQKESAGTPVSDMSIRTLRKEIKQCKSANTEIIPINSSKETLNIE